MLDAAVRRRQKARNAAQALALLGGMVAVLGLVAWMLLGPFGLLYAVILGVATLSLRPRMPTRWVLTSVGAMPLPRAASPALHRLVDVLAERAGLRRAPDVYYVRAPVMNAFAVGRRGEAALAVTDGLLRGLSSRQLAGVIAHELSHVRADDLWVMQLSDTVGRATHALAYAGLLLFVLAVPATDGVPVVLLVLLLAPTIATLLQLALSRAREHDADLEAAWLTGDPEGLAGALERLEAREGRGWERTLTPRPRGPGTRLLRTHPPTAQRVRRLLSLRVPRATVPLGDEQPIDLPGLLPPARRTRRWLPGRRGPRRGQ